MDYTNYFEIPVSIYKHGKDKLSMADLALRDTSVVEYSGGKYYVTLFFAPLSIMGIVGEVNALLVLSDEGYVPINPVAIDGYYNRSYTIIMDDKYDKRSLKLKITSMPSTVKAELRIFWD